MLPILIFPNDVRHEYELLFRMPKQIALACKTFNLRSTKKQKTLDTKHIKKFKFPANLTVEQQDKHIIGSTSIETDRKNKNSGFVRTERKRKMADRNNSVNYKNKVNKLYKFYILVNRELQAFQ